MITRYVIQEGIVQTVHYSFRGDAGHETSVFFGKFIGASLLQSKCATYMTARSNVKFS